jgi:isopenicillin-N N-acyltransferase like protein
VSVPFPHIVASGSYREIGRQIGEAARGQVAAALAYYREHFVAMAGITFAEAERRASEYLVHARRHLPQYVEELEGLAEGSRQPFPAVLVPNCGEEFTHVSPSAEDGAPPHRTRGCTSVAVVTAERRVVGHNMDWYAVDLDKNVLFDVTCPDGTRFLTIAGVPYLPILGVNSHGIAYVGNSLSADDPAVGIPNVFVRRWALEAPTLEEARARATMPQRACGSNHLLGDASGRLWDIETSATEATLTVTSGWYAHTNHYTLPSMLVHEINHQEESRLRLRRAEAMLAEGTARGDDPLELVALVLRDHAHAPDAICGHPALDGVRPDESITVASMIIDVDERTAYACAGPPCENDYRVFQL